MHPIGSYLLGVSALAILSQPASAAPAQVAFSIEAGPLQASLLTYAAQSRRQILFQPGQVAGRSAPALKGAYTPDAALARLLEGTGLTAQQSGPGVFVLRATSQPARAGQPRALSDPHAMGREAGEAAQPPSGTPAAYAPVERAEPALLDEVVITGSLIRGADAPTSPLLLLGRDDVDRMGAPTVADMLAALPQNFGGAGSADAAILGTDGRNTNDLAATGVNLRGLGAGATLVLVNGRRMGGTGSKADFADVSAVPTAAVDRIDVLLDGASALYQPNALSPAGAAGLTQLMPATARELGVVDRFDPEENLMGGADYLARQIRRFGDLRLALAAYNAGPSRVASQGAIPQIAETRSYVAKVVSCFLALSIGRSVTSADACGPPGEGS